MSTSSFKTYEFDPKALSFDIKEHKWISFDPKHKLYKELLGYIAAHLVNDASGYVAEVIPQKAVKDKKKKGTKEKEAMVHLPHGRMSVKIGFGEYAFRSFDNHIIYAVHNMMGDPVGTDCGVRVMEKLILFTKEPLEVLTSFLTTLTEMTEVTDDGTFICYIWHIRYSYWREESRIKSRPISSVVLPSETKNRVIRDIEKFLSDNTQDFYTRNGIPYRRSYLFHGLPGTSKTSFVQALAGHFNRSVCFLLPSHPDMTDDSLREAINQIPDNSIVVFEDIDSLFSKDRSSKVEKSALTFSGLLNCLDGIGNPNGQIFILTTNLRDQLDHALIRNGRVDMHVEFTHATNEQIEIAWKNFYPEYESRGADFAVAVRKLLDENELKVSMAELQHYFITQMDSTADEAFSNISLIIQEIQFNSSQSMLETAKLEKSESSNDEEKEAESSVDNSKGKKKNRRRRSRKAKGTDNNKAESKVEKVEKEVVVE